MTFSFFFFLFRFVLVMCFEIPRCLPLGSGRPFASLMVRIFEGDGPDCTVYRLAKRACVVHVCCA